MCPLTCDVTDGLMSLMSLATPWVSTCSSLSCLALLYTSISSDSWLNVLIWVRGTRDIPTTMFMDWGRPHLYLFTTRLMTFGTCATMLPQSLQTPKRSGSCSCLCTSKCEQCDFTTAASLCVRMTCGTRIWFKVKGFECQHCPYMSIWNMFTTRLMTLDSDSLCRKSRQRWIFLMWEVNKDGRGSAGFGSSMFYFLIQCYNQYLLWLVICNTCLAVPWSR